MWELYLSRCLFDNLWGVAMGWGRGSWHSHSRRGSDSPCLSDPLDRVWIDQSQDPSSSSPWGLFSPGSRLPMLHFVQRSHVTQDNFYPESFSPSVEPRAHNSDMIGTRGIFLSNTKDLLGSNSGTAMITFCTCLPSLHKVCPYPFFLPVE